MKVITGSRKRHYVIRGSIFLITAVLVWAMVGCTEVYPTEYKLTISSTTGGSVVSPREGTSTHLKGTLVTLIAVPHDGYRFVSWTGDVGAIRDVKSAQTVITIRREYSITAEFEKIPEYHLTVSTTGGGWVIKPKEGMSTYKGEKVVELEACENVSWGFVNWTGDVGTVANVNAAVTTIRVDGNYSIRANFEKEEAVNIADSSLEAAIRKATGIAERPLYPSDLKKLTSLDAGAKNVSNLTGLEYCTGLTKLYLRDNRIRDISPLASLTSLTSLTRLDLSGNQIDDISPLASLTSLTELYLSGNQISDISPLANITGLTRLYLSGNQIDDISPLASLTSLTELYLSGNQISDISPLANITGLTRLYLSGNQIDDISPLAKLTSLTELYLSGNQIDDISPLAKLTRLTYLYLSGNQISDISPLGSLTKLRDLSLGGNQISDISPLVSLSSLTLLNLSNNQISDIEPLVDNPGLSQGDKVYLYNNPLSLSALSYSTVSTHIAQLEVRGVIVEY
jgi:Leucine-rich repeat (LRR) protein